MHARARRRPYIVTVHPEGRWWHIRVPELGGGAVSQALQLNEVSAQARDLIALWLDVPPEQVRLLVRRRGGLRPGWADSLLDAYGRD